MPLRLEPAEEDAREQRDARADRDAREYRAEEGEGRVADRARAHLAPVEELHVHFSGVDLTRFKVEPPAPSTREIIRDLVL